MQKRKPKKKVSRLVKSIEPGSYLPNYQRIVPDTDPDIVWAVVCDFIDGRYGKIRTEQHQLALDKDGNER